ncbi:heterogeneous nuclear ribonucleoprotein U-like protein 1 [Montipora capricornis]|uniref:heterogeneous nuclear ribonucleoprotein U-like protein 1 n=1 Tax=Montipora capricornis TaxID=246305 RepID=UPI0035F174ED
MYQQAYSQGYNQFGSYSQYESQNAGFDSRERSYGSDASGPRVVLDDYNCDLNFVIESDGVTGSSLHKDGFEYMWAGARATHGVKAGKVYFEVNVLEKLPVSMPETETKPHVVRLGWSVDRANLQVGEDNLSFGYGGTGKVSVKNKFFDYGEPYTSGDIITCYIDLDANPRVILYSKNGKNLGVAFRLDHDANGQTFFPHVTVKNMRLSINFGQYEPYFPPLQGFSLLSRLPPQFVEPGSLGPSSREQCEIIMMVGLPGSGKTFWAERYAKDHPDKKFNILGTNTIMDRMKVMGLMRKRNYHGRWDALIKQATDVLNKVFKIAEKKNRNYILDQTNVYFSARRRKMNNFRGFHRIAAVIVNTNDVLKERTEKREREEGKIVPQSAVMEMKANFVLPEVGEVFNDVWFIEEDQTSSERLVSEFQCEGKEFKESEKKRKPEVSSCDGRQFSVDKRPRLDQESPYIPLQHVPRDQYRVQTDSGGFRGNYNPREPRSAPHYEPVGGPLPGTYGTPIRSYNESRPPHSSVGHGDPRGAYNTGSQNRFSDYGPSYIKQETHGYNEPCSNSRNQSRYPHPTTYQANYQPPSQDNRRYQAVSGEGHMYQPHYQGPSSGDLNSYSGPAPYGQHYSGQNTGQLYSQRQDYYKGGTGDSQGGGYDHQRYGGRY